MSYILDALRRAEAERERERGAVPGVHAQPAAVADTPARSGLRGPPWWGVAAGGLLGAAAVAALWLGGRAPVTPPSAPAPAPLAGGPGPAAPAVAIQAPAAPTAPSANPSPLAVVSAPEAVPGPPPLPAASALPVPVPVPRSAATVESRPQPWGELSAEQKREWPAMTIGGSIYSDNASSRFVMVNGQVVREGEAAAPGVTVERIGPKSVVLRWKDRRVEMPF